MAPGEIKEEVGALNEDALFADGFDDALIGYVEKAGGPVVALYDSKKCLEILMKRDGMTVGEAEEFFNFNTVTAYMGPNTPAFATIRTEDP